MHARLYTDTQARDDTRSNNSACKSGREHKLNEFTNSVKYICIDDRKRNNNKLFTNVTATKKQ